jgi:hypothetical protein
LNTRLKKLLFQIRDLNQPLLISVPKERDRRGGRVSSGTQR